MPFTEDQIDHLTNTLDPNVVAERTQSGRSFSYVEAWHAIAEANRIFGFGAWDRETIDTRCVQERERTIGKAPNEKPGWGVSYVCRVRVTVRASGETVVREGTGAGHGIDADLGQAHESAVKEAESDAMKRALMQFGNPFGLALYDKTRAGVAVPRQTKAESRGLYEALQAGLRAQKGDAALLKWATDNADDIRTLPKDWADELKDELKAEITAYREAKEGNGAMDREYREVVSA
jgi:recombination DNA repair RAD52 pathway protein